jgi:hypothetical protein
LAVIVLGSVPGLVAAHPESRHWVQRVAAQVALVLPWSESAPQVERRQGGVVRAVFD